MKQFLVSKKLTREETVSFESEDFHYLARVKRLTKGDTLSAKDSAGQLWQLVITERRESSLLCSVKARLASQKTDSWENIPLHLFQALPKGKKMDLILRQAVEANVSSITPLFTENSLVQLPTEKDKAKKRERWQRIAQEALQQSGRKNLPIIHSPRPLTEILSSDFSGELFFCHQEKLSDQPLRETLPSLRSQGMGIVIGPEGGFSPKEVEGLLQSGAHPVYWGSFVLRTETAALYSIAAFQTLLREL